ncbi:hypothetical protein HGRIS_007017 [Hohenbuehelia grisea]|uniref:SUI1 domain-containing protein n=1 Tax=Hohenbuehelia grisea TaxID=104357 RepID=A0ABR3JB55_9AGAR
MFKKPLSNLKTSAPLRSSERRKLKQKIVQVFSIPPEDGDLLVPDGLLSVKFSTHLGDPGVAYLSPDGGDPLWFSIGKNSDELIPTVYTLWKRPAILPSLSTPAPVIPVLIGGADLMIPGVVQYPPAISKGQLVAVTEYVRDGTKRGYPLAVGHIAVDASSLAQEGKGKAVFVKHTWKDTLWDMGTGGAGEVPEPYSLDNIPGHLPDPAEELSKANSQGSAPLSESVQHVQSSSPAQPPPNQQDPPVPSHSAEEVTNILRTSLIQAIATTISGSSFPLPASTLYAAHILPARPGHPPFPSPVDIKHSTHKSLTSFLKAAEKERLVTLKASKAKAGGDNLVVTSVNAQHPDVLGHHKYTTLGDVEAKREQREEREERDRNRAKELVVAEAWKPLGSGSTAFFTACGKSTTALYTLSEIRAAINHYVTDKQLINPREQQYINVDEVLRAAMQGKGDQSPEFMKRDEITRHVVNKMQAWHSVTPEGKEPAFKKGVLKPISVAVKIKQGRKAVTLITGFEPFLLVADDLAEELRKVCASATSVTPIPGKTAGQEVAVQGKQIPTVTDLLLAKGVSKKWIESADMSDKKK